MNPTSSQNHNHLSRIPPTPILTKQASHVIINGNLVPITRSFTK